MSPIPYQLIDVSNNNIKNHTLFYQFSLCNWLLCKGSWTRDWFPTFFLQVLPNSSFLCKNWYCLHTNSIDFFAKITGPKINFRLFFIRSLPFYLSFVKIWYCLHTNSRMEWVVICQVQVSPILKKVSLNEKLKSTFLLFWIRTYHINLAFLTLLLCPIWFTF